jgi:16S rRNA (adenine1518-N6/adenine1519-N6)-dimethyltransferase
MAAPSLPHDGTSTARPGTRPIRDGRAKVAYYKAVLSTVRIMPQTLSEIRATLDAAGLRPRRRFGQNFMIDGNLMNKVVEAAEVTSDRAVLEVGCGTGSLTELLLERAGWVIGVEIDRGLAGCLEQRLANRPNWTLIHADVLACKSRIAPVVLSALREQAAAGRPLQLVANLPYSIACPLLVDLLLCGVPMQRYCVVVQKEVAERIMAVPGSREYGPISVVLQSCADIRRIAHIPPQAFWPAPQVASQAIRLDLHRRPFEPAGPLGGFVELVRAGFAHRRKTLHYNLRPRYAERLDGAIAELGLDVRIRAEAVSVGDWIRLFRSLGGFDGFSPTSIQ